MTANSTDQNHLICLGFGYTAGFVAPLLQTMGWQVSGTTRLKDKAALLRDKAVTPILWPEGNEAPEVDFSSVTDVLVSISPNESGCPALDILHKIRTRMPTLRSVIYFSSTGVCGDHQGAWIDEDTPLTSTLRRGRHRLKAEEDWQSFGRDENIPVIILRLSGIYGPGRNAFVTLKRQGTAARRVFKEGQVFNRIHVEDIAAITSLAFNRLVDGTPPPHNVYNLADDEPAPPQDLIEYAAKQMGWPVPPLVPIEGADLSDMARSFYAENKRIRNSRIKQDFDYTLLYPNWRAGLDALASIDGA
ncbi:MAG: SDR family oxidoreductase [Aquisalinus sp.]|nr:SDR family oxidoreductase [Aquisalinus sp.]